MSKSATNRIAPVATVWLVDGRTVDERKLEARSGWLTPAETQRYLRFIRPERQHQFLVGRVLLRIALGELLGVEPPTLAFSERPGQVPLLHREGEMPGFSISHSGAWVACAVSAQSALGLDIEVLDPDRDLIALGEQAFSREETEWLRTMEGVTRVKEFYALWSKKEAAYKLSAGSVVQARQHFCELAHPDISIALCSETPLSKVMLRKVDDL